MTESKNYEFTGETKTLYGRTVRQIRAITAIASLFVSPGDVGGWIENESNLTQSGEAWVHPNGCIIGKYAVMRGGVMRGGVMRGGEMWGGEMWGGDMWGGVMHGGVMRGGVMRGGEMWGGEMRINAIFIAGLRWQIAINDDQMTIGCQSHDLHKWWKYCDATIAKMDSGALEFWHANKAMLQAICASTGRLAS